jgi:hypothetical protein
MRKIWKIAVAILASMSLLLSCLLFVHAALSYRDAPENNELFQGHHGRSGFIGDANHVFEECDGSFILYDVHAPMPICKLNLWLLAAFAALPPVVWVAIAVRNRVRLHKRGFPVEQAQGPERRGP